MSLEDSEVFEIIIPLISFSKRISEIKLIWFSSISGEIFTTIGIFVSKFFFFSETVLSKSWNFLLS